MKLQTLLKRIREIQPLLDIAAASLPSAKAKRVLNTASTSVAVAQELLASAVEQGKETSKSRK